MKKITYLFIVGFIIILSCGNYNKSYAVFDYDDFGPQAMAWKHIGMQWWQWEDHGDSDPKSKYDIKVIVYKGAPLEKIKKLFPVNRFKNLDFRYFEYDESIKYLNRKIEELNTEKEEWAVNLRQHLIETKDVILLEISAEK